MNTPTPSDRLVKPSEAADLLAISRRSLRRYVAQGKLQRIKLNPRATRYWLSEVMRLAGGIAAQDKLFPPQSVCSGVLLNQ